MVAMDFLEGSSPLHRGAATRRDPKDEGLKTMAATRIELGAWLAAERA
jgi:hypothetical protein